MVFVVVGVSSELFLRALRAHAHGDEGQHHQDNDQEEQEKGDYSDHGRKMKTNFFGVRRAGLSESFLCKQTGKNMC